MEKRRGVNESIATLQRTADKVTKKPGRTRTQSQLDKEQQWTSMLVAARRATQRSRKGITISENSQHTVTPDDWDALRRLMATVVPEWEPEVSTEKESDKKAGMTVAVVDYNLREMRNTAASILQEHREAERAGVAWLERRERAHGLLQVILRAWRERVEYTNVRIRSNTPRWRVRELRSRRRGPNTRHVELPLCEKTRNERRAALYGKDAVQGHVEYFSSLIWRVRVTMEYMRIVTCCTVQRRAARARWEPAISTVCDQIKEEKRRKAAEVEEASSGRPGKRAAGKQGGYNVARAYHRKIR